MSRIALAAAIVAAAPFSVFAETLLVGFYSPPQTDDEVIKLLAEPGEIGYVESGVDIDGGVSVRKIVMDRDTGRSKGFARMGLVGHEVPEPEDCTFDLSGRVDALGIALKEQEDAVNAYRLGLIVPIAMEKELRALEQAEAAAKVESEAANDAAKKAGELHTAAHEAAHVVQQRAQAARATANKKKGQPFEVAALTLELEYQKLLAADVAAEAALEEANAAAKIARDRFDNIRQERLLKTEDLKRVRAENTLARARAEELRVKAGELVNAQILRVCEDAVADARSLADEFADAADTAYAVGGFASKLGGFAKGVAKAMAIGDAYADASAQASAVSELGLTIVEQQRKAGPIPPLNTVAEVEELPQMHSLVEVMMAVGMSGGLALANAMGVKGENPLFEAKSELRIIIQDTCGPDDDCDGEADELLRRVENMQYLALQSAMQNENRQYTTVSNVLKTKHDTVKNSINNVR